MAVLMLHILRSAVYVALSLSIVQSQSIDPALTTSGNRGKAIVQKAINLVETTFKSTDKLLERTAWVESKFGNAPNTFRAGYHGGIWQVDSIGLRDTQDVSRHSQLSARHGKILQDFGIDWGSVKYSDLRKPLHSAIAARLLYLNQVQTIPTGLSDQAKYWKKYYNKNGRGTAMKFAMDVMFYDKSIKPRDLVGVGNLKRGRKIFIQKGSQCHTTGQGGMHKTGPNLSGISGRKAGTSPGYSYTNSMKNSNIMWSAATLYRFLQNPRKSVPGTKMVFAGIKKIRDLMDLIAYLGSI